MFYVIISVFLSPAFVPDLDSLKADLLREKNTHEQKAIRLGQQKGENDVRVVAVDRLLAARSVSKIALQANEAEKVSLERKNVEISSGIDLCVRRSAHVSGLMNVLDQARNPALCHDQRSKELIRLEVEHDDVARQIERFQNVPESTASLGRSARLHDMPAEVSLAGGLAGLREKKRRLSSKIDALKPEIQALEQQVEEKISRVRSQFGNLPSGF